MGMQKARVYEFGPFRLAPAQGTLFRQGTPVSVAPKAFEALVLLVEQRDRLVAKEELMKTLWPDTFVEEANLNHYIWTLRKTLAEVRGGERYIQTVARRGFRFVAPVKESAGEDGEILHEPNGLNRPSSEECMAEAAPATTRADGMRSMPPLVSTVPTTGVKSYLLIAVAIALALGVVLSIRGWRASRSETGDSAAPMRPLKSIAVLPLKSIGPAADNEYLQLGIADSLITKLANVKEVAVRPTSAVRKYLGPRQDPVAAGREQHVEAVLDGNVQRSGERIRVTVQLVRVRDGASLWSGTFDEHFTDIFAVEDSISQQVARRLSVELSSEERNRLELHSTTNAEAHDAYFKGRYSWNKRTSKGFNKALEYFNKAIAVDPNYALAYVGVADSYTMLADYDWLPPSEAATKAKAAVTRALEIDDGLAEAHASLADIRRFYDWDWAGAEREYKRAIELNPNYVTAHQWYAEYLSAMGRHEQAAREMERAQELDPLSVVVKSANGWVLLFARDYDKAIAQCQQVIEMDPSFGEVYSQLRRAYEQKGMYMEALAADEKFRVFKRKGAHRTGWQPEARRFSGAKAYWRKMRALTENDLRNNLEAARFRMAEIYAQLGQKDQAFEWLERNYQEHTFWMPFLAVHPHLDPLRSDPRFSGLMRRMNLVSTGRTVP
jgi:TolB-like protein/DNA-binding winged helix-turn-helix (wHTH) protein/Tfp pilus assembly protein PilF